MVSLKDVGITHDSPAEVVLTTFYPNGNPHAAIVGVTAKGEKLLLLRIFLDTKTYQNVVAAKSGVINITNNAELIAKIALPDISGLDEKTLDYKNSEYVNAPKLTGADAHVEIVTSNIQEAQWSDDIGASKVAHIITYVKNIELSKPSTHPFKRTDSFLIESAVLASKALEALKNDRTEVAKKLLKKIDQYKSECKRIAPESKYFYFISKITSYLKNRLGE